MALQGIPCSSGLHLAVSLMLILNLMDYRASCSHVPETQAEYPCPEGAPYYDVDAESAGFDNTTQAQCGQEWSIKTSTGITNIAIYSEGCGGEQCIMVQPGNIRLSTCENVTLSIQCHRYANGLPHIEESIIHFTGVLRRPVVNSTVATPLQEGTEDGSHGSVVAGVVVAALLVLALAVAGLVWKVSNCKTPSTVV